MSGTIPVEMKSLLRRELYLIKDTVVICQLLNRPKLKYVINPPLTDTTLVYQQVEEIVKQQNMSPEDKGLVFMILVSNGYTLALLLKCNFYCMTKSVKDSGDNEQTGAKGFRPASALRSKAVAKWTQEINPVIVVMTAFAMGNDFPHVRFVILATIPFDMCSVIQEMGKAGRDRKPAFCYVIPTQTLHLPPGSQNNNLQEHKAMIDMIWKSNECIQLCLTRYVDRDGGISCCDDAHNWICSCCHAH